MKSIPPLLCLLAAFAITGCEPADSSSATASSATNNSSGNPLTAPVDYLGAVSKGGRNSEATISLTATQQAIQMFNVTEGRYPKDIDELVSTHYLAVKPKMPHGQKLTYNAVDGSVKVEPVK